MNILDQRWFPIGELALAFFYQATLAQCWVSIGNIGTGFISAPNNDIILVQHIGNRPATNIEQIIRIMLAQIGLRVFFFFFFFFFFFPKNSRVRKEQNDIPIH